jgi:hypothetical protein
MAIQTVFITSGTTYTIPSDFVSIVSVEAIGGGGSATVSGYGGGGGGAYAKTTSITGLTASGTAYCSIGAAAGDTWFNGTSNAAPTTTNQGVLAKGGASATGNSGASGGASGSCVGNTSFSGGNGGAGQSSSANGVGGGGGGAGGPNGAGGNGGAAFALGGGGSGGGAGDTTGAGSAGAAGTLTAGAQGGAAGNGTAGGTGATSAVSATAGSNGSGGGSGCPTAGRRTGATGGTGTYWTQTSNSATAGGGGGTGGMGLGNSGSTINTSLYGAGASGQNTFTSGLGGTGAQGIVVFTYNTTTAPHFVAASAVVNGSNPTVAVPTGYAAGDLLILFIGNTTTTVSTPSGWTLYYNGNTRIQLFYKIAGASESSVSLTSTGTAQAAVMLAYRNASGIGTSSTLNTASSTSPVTNTLVTPVNNCSILSVYSFGGAVNSTITPPASTIERVNQASTTGNIRGLDFVDEIVNTAGTTTTARTATLSASASWYTLALPILPILTINSGFFFFM